MTAADRPPVSGEPSPIEQAGSILAHYDVDDVDWERLRPLIRATPSTGVALDADVAARVFHSMFHGGGADLATCLRPGEDRANASMFINRYARLAEQEGEEGR